MILTDLPGITPWLDQFEIPDLYLAEHILRRMRYVGFTEFEEWLQREVAGLLAEIERRRGKEAVAIFPVAKPFINVFNADKEAKPPNDSAGRIAHSLKNLLRSPPQHVELTPRLESMRSRKVRHIIFVDDFIGTGNRFIESWKETVHPSVKAWCSRGWCKVWLIAFAAHASGVRRIIRRVRPLVKERIRIHLEIGRTFFDENDNLKAVLENYGERVGRPKGAWGYGNLASPIIFQHGCPNNVSEILWKSGVGPKKMRWQPLFRNRSVSSALYPLFEGDVALESSPEELWMAKQYRLAVTALEHLETFRGNHRQLLILALAQKRKKLEQIRSILVLTRKEFDALIGELYAAGLLDDEGVISRFGLDVLKRVTQLRRPRLVESREMANFFPASFLGFQREA